MGWKLHVHKLQWKVHYTSRCVAHPGNDVVMCLSTCKCDFLTAKMNREFNVHETQTEMHVHVERGNEKDGLLSEIEPRHLAAIIRGNGDVWFCPGLMAQWFDSRRGKSWILSLTQTSHSLFLFQPVFHAHIMTRSTKSAKMDMCAS